jgi:hypothetical protein
MVEDIITALSWFKALFVIARNSSFTYKGKAVKQVAANWACGTLSKAAFAKLETAFALLRSSLMLKVAHVFGLTGSTGPWRTCSISRIGSQLKSWAS